MTREPIGTPDGFGWVLLKWGQRVRVELLGGPRKTYLVSECVFLKDEPERPSASVTVLADWRRRKNVKAVMA